MIQYQCNQGGLAHTSYYLTGGDDMADLEIMFAVLNLLASVVLIVVTAMKKK